MNILVPPLFEIFTDGNGLWRARRRDGLAEGIFASRAEAARFVLGEIMALNSDSDDRSAIAASNQR